MQNEKYPNDPRIGATYLSYYTTTTGGSTTTYPTRANRATANFNNAFPYFVKFAAKDPSHSSSETNQNYIVYRYADFVITSYSIHYTKLYEVVLCLKGPD